MKSKGVRAGGLNRQHAWELDLLSGRSTGVKRKGPSQNLRNKKKKEDLVISCPST